MKIWKPSLMGICSTSHLPVLCLGFTFRAEPRAAVDRLHRAGLSLKAAGVNDMGSHHMVRPALHAWLLFEDVTPSCFLSCFSPDTIHSYFHIKKQGDTCPWKTAPPVFPQRTGYSKDDAWVKLNTCLSKNSRPMCCCI